MTVWGGGDKAYFAKLNRERKTLMKPGTPVFPVPPLDDPRTSQIHKDALYGAKNKPFLNVVCGSLDSWTKLLLHLPERHRFSVPSRYDQHLITAHGRPLYVSTDFADFHIYPPGRD